MQLGVQKATQKRVKSAYNPKNFEKTLKVFKSCLILDIVVRVRKNVNM